MYDVIWMMKCLKAKLEPLQEYILLARNINEDRVDLVTSLLSRDRVNSIRLLTTFKKKLRLLTT